MRVNLARYEAKRSVLVSIREHFREVGRFNAVRIAEKIIEHYDKSHYYHWKREMHSLFEKMDAFDEAIAKGNQLLVSARKDLETMDEKLSSLDHNTRDMFDVSGVDWSWFDDFDGETEEEGTDSKATGEHSAYRRKLLDKKGKTIAPKGMDHEIQQKLASMVLEKIEEHLGDEMEDDNIPSGEMEEAKVNIGAEIEQNVATAELEGAKGNAKASIDHKKALKDLEPAQEKVEDAVDHSTASENLKVVKGECQRFHEVKSAYKGTRNDKEKCERLTTEEYNKEKTEIDNSWHNITLEECKEERQKTS